MISPADERAAAVMEAVRKDHPDLPIYDQYDRALLLVASSLASVQRRIARLRLTGSPEVVALAVEEQILLCAHQRLQQLRRLYIDRLREEMGPDPIFWALLRTPTVDVPRKAG